MLPGCLLLFCDSVACLLGSQSQSYCYHEPLNTTITDTSCRNSEAMEPFNAAFHPPFSREFHNPQSTCWATYMQILPAHVRIFNGWWLVIMYVCHCNAQQSSNTGIVIIFQSQIYLSSTTWHSVIHHATSRLLTDKTRSVQSSLLAGLQLQAENQALEGSRMPLPVI